MKIYIIWLIGVMLWNFGVPDASPLEDVLVAIVLSFLSIILGLSGYLLTLTFGPLYSLLSFVLIGMVFIYLSIKLEKNLNLGPKIS